MAETDFKIWKTPELARRYLSGIRMAFPGAIQQIEILLKIVAAGKKDIGKILDLGCGDGILGAALLDKYPNSKCVFLDFSGEMLKAASNKLINLKDRIELVSADYSDREWIQLISHNAPFDLIISGYSIHHQSHERKKELYAEIFGLLDTNGLFINIEHVLSPTKWIESIHDDYFIDSLYQHELENNTGKSREDVSVEYYNRADQDANILASVEEQCQWLEDIGFNDVDCYFKLFELAVFGGRK